MWWLSLSMTHTHTLNTHTLTLSMTNTHTQHTHTLTLTHSPCLRHTHTHTHTHTLITHSPCLWHTHTHTHTHTHSTHTRCLWHTHTHTHTDTHLGKHTKSGSFVMLVCAGIPLIYRYCQALPVRVWAQVRISGRDNAPGNSPNKSWIYSINSSGVSGWKRHESREEHIWNLKDQCCESREEHIWNLKDQCCESREEHIWNLKDQFCVSSCGLAVVSLSAYWSPIRCHCLSVYGAIRYRTNVHNSCSTTVH